ncbi:MAG: hypothetical protein ACOC2W_01280 [bacterium]
MPENGELKVWWIPQIPMKKFEVPVNSIKESALIIDTLARYDLFQYYNNVKTDYANAGGLLVYDKECIENNDPETGWVEWSDDEGRDVNEWIVEVYEKYHKE